MKSWLYILFLLPLLCGCEKELDFHYHDVESQLVIEGRLRETGAKITLSYTVPMGEASDSVFLRDAEVRLTDLIENETVTLKPDKDGIFTDSKPGRPGHEYLLSVKRDGKEFSAMCRMRQRVDSLELSFQWIKMPYDHVAVLQVSFNESPDPDDCYWIRLYRNDAPYKWLLSSGKNAVNGKINEVTFTTRKDLEEEDEKDILRDGDRMTARVVAVSREMYDYLVAVQSDSNGPQMFSGDFCLGYFLAGEEAEETIVFHPDEIPGPF